MKLKIVTPERVVLQEDDIEAVYAVTTDGEIGILPKHIPLVAPLSISLLRYMKSGSKTKIAVMGGILRTNGKEVSILSDAAELSGEIDTLRAQNAKDRAEARLREKSEKVDVNRAQLALSRSMTRLTLAESSKS